MIPAFAFIAWAASASVSAPSGVHRPAIGRVALSGAVSGRVVGDDGATLQGAVVSIAELGMSAVTGTDGGFQLGTVPAGRYTISARRLGYTAASTELLVESGPVAVTLTLHAGALQIEPVNVTAARTPEGAIISPLPASVLGNDLLRRDAGVSLAHSLARLPGVRNHSSGEQIGKPVIRGLFGPRVLVLDDGSRLEDYSWSDEDGPTIDARLAERVEVIRGPASVLYGSEALGGVINVVPAALPFSSDGTPTRRAAAEAYGGSNNLELGTTAMLEGARNNFGWRLLGTGRFAQNYRTPHAEIGNSSFFTFNGDGAFGFKDEHGTTTVRVSHYGGEFHLLEASGPDAADPNGGPVRQTLDDRIQVTNDHLIGGVRFETKAQYQRHGLTEVSDDCVPAQGQTTCVKVKDQVAFDLTLNTGTLDLLAHHAIGDHITGTVGVSGMYQVSTSGGPITLVPGATVNSGAAFGFEQFTAGIVTLVAGVRADTRHLSADANSALTLAADSRSWTSATGDAGVVLRASNELSLVANYGTGWRAPTLFDLYANGPNLAEARFEKGDPTLTTERARNVDVGLRWTSRRAHGEAFVFRNLIDDYIYTTPTSTAINGLPVYRHIQGDARLSGAEVSFEARVLDPLVVHGSYDEVRGTDLRQGVPLPLMPPPRTLAGAQLDLGALGIRRRGFIGAEVEYVQRQSRLNPQDYATGSHTLLNLDFATEGVIRSRPVRFEVDVRNATNAAYRDFLSRYKTFADAAGANVVARVTSTAW